MSFLSSLFSKSQTFDFHGLTEWHCHILPGVDDGVESLETSLEILNEYERMGIEKVWLTPHIMEDVPNTPESLKSRFEELKKHYNGNITLRLAAENMIDRLFSERLEADTLLPIGEKQNMLLVETSYFNAPYNFHKTLERIKAKGFYPLLAHPERYNYIEKFEEYENLKALGVLFQLNLLSLTGYYGKPPKEKALKMLKAGMYDFFGSDLHRPEQLIHLNNLTLNRDIIRALQLIRTKSRF